MAKTRSFRLFLHKLNDIRIKGFHRRRRSPSSPSSPRIASQRIIIRCSSHKGPCFGCACSPRVLHALPKLDRPLQVNVLSESTVNHKAIDVSALATSCPSPPLRMGLLNSPTAHTVLLRSPLHPAASLKSRSSARRRPPVSVSRDRRSVSVDCGCQAPLVSSFRKAKENFRSIKSEDHDRRSKRREKSAEENRRISGTIWDKSSEGRLNVSGIKVDIDTDQNKGVGKEKKSIEVQSANTELECKASSLEGKSGVSEKPEGTPNAGKSAKLAGRPAKDLSDSIRSGKFATSGSTSFRLSTSSGDACRWDACSVAWDKEYSSFTSDETFFSSFEIGRRSHSSNSSSELLEKNHGRSFNKQGRAKRSNANGSLNFQVLKIREDGIDMEKGTGLVSEFSPARCDSGVLNSSPVEYEHLAAKEKGSAAHGGPQFMNDQGVIYPWLSHEGSCSPADAPDLEANAKAWAENLFVGAGEDEELSAGGAARCLRSEDRNCAGSQTMLQRSDRRRRNSRNPQRKGDDSSVRRRANRQWSAEQIIQWQSGDESTASSNKSKPPKTASSKVISRRSSSRGASKHGYGGLAKPKIRTLENKIQVPPSIQIRDSVAVVKCSRNPLSDFRDSMVDMILEKQLYAAPDLEELLQCFLSLNSLEHHDTIVRAFTDVWEKVFEDPATDNHHQNIS